MLEHLLRLLLKQLPCFVTDFLKALQICSHSFAQSGQVGDFNRDLTIALRMETLLVILCSAVIWSVVIYTCSPLQQPAEIYLQKRDTFLDPLEQVEARMRILAAFWDPERK